MDAVAALEATGCMTAIYDPDETLLPESEPVGPERLGRKVGSAVRWSFANSVFSRLSQVGVGILLARVIAPEQFGVYAAALVVLNIILSISEMGVSVAIVRHDGDISELAPTTTTLSLASGLLLAVVCAGGAPWFAAALGAPDATGVIQLMSLSLLIAGASAVPSAILQREFRQDHKMAADTVSFFVSTAVAVALALSGFGAWSLAWSRVAGSFAAAVVMLILTKERYRPGFHLATAKSLLAFGLPLAGSSLLVFGVMNVDYIVVGSYLGPVALGLYLLAFNLSSWPVGAFSTPVRSVSLAAFSRLRSEPERFQASFVRALGMLMALTVPACVLLAAFGRPLVRVVYGERWLPAAAPLAVLAALGALRVALELAYDYLASAGLSKTILKIHVLWLAGLIPALTIGAHLDGIRGVGFGHVVVVGLVVTPAYLAALHGLGVELAGIGRALVRPVIGGVLMVVAALLAQFVVAADLLRLGVGGSVAALVYAVAVYPMRHSLMTRTIDA
jgi:O-antigen/teichoic acid export membrane protein